MYLDRIWTLLARKLAAEISSEELAELEVILKSDPLAHLKIQTIEEDWKKSNEAVRDENEAPEKEHETAFIQLAERLNEHGLPFMVPAGTGTGNPPFHNNNYRSRSFRQLIIAAALLIVAGLGAIFIFLAGKNNAHQQASATPNDANVISTKYGSRSKVELPDGSIVWLNSGSRLTYDKLFGNHVREVNLSGEGFFEVVHNADKPFIIHTAFFDIKDLGTQFNVKCYPNDKITETSLVEGSVEITVKKRPNEKYILKPDEKLVLLNQNWRTDSLHNNGGKKINRFPSEPIVAIKPLTYRAEDSFSVETAWTYNKLSFDDEAFSEVAKKMERWFDRRIVFKNKKLENIHLTVSFINESFEQAIEALKYTNRFNYVIKDGQVTIY